MQQQGVDEAQDIRTERQAEAGGEAASQNAFGTILTGQAVAVRKNSAGAEVTQPRLNLIEGVNITITLADDSVNSEADITIAVKSNPTFSGQVRMASLGVGNSAAATTPGTVVKKIEVFDAAGVSLGFVAVYDAIT